MGFRNPFRITIDPNTGWVLLGNYGPDAGATNPNRGPQGSVEFDVIKEPGFYGWPYCVRDNVPYNDFNFANNTSGPKFNCDAPGQQLAQQHGHHQPAAGQAGDDVGGLHRDRPARSRAWARAARRPAARATSSTRTSTARPSSRRVLRQELVHRRVEQRLAPHRDARRPTATATGVFQTPWEDTFFRPHEIEFGPDGSLYVIDWGDGFNGNNANSGIYRIDYTAGARRPIARATSDKDNGPTPLTVQFSSDGSQDPDGTSLTYAWDFDGNGTTDSTEANPSHTYATAGTYNATLTVTDGDGQTGFDTIPITAGNTRPTVTITVPEDGQFAAFGDIVPYKITVTDPEDGTGRSTAAASRSTCQLGHDQHAHPLAARSGLLGHVPEHDRLRPRGEREHLHLDRRHLHGQAPRAQRSALTGQDDLILQPKPKQAEFFKTTGRTGANTGGTPGVQTETTADAGGGLNIGFIEHGDYVSYDPVNLEELTGHPLPRRLRRRRRHDRGPPRLADRRAGRLGRGRQHRRLAELDQRRRCRCRNPPAGTHELFLVFTNPTADGAGGLFNLNYFTALGKGAANSDAPEVSADADPMTGDAPLEVHFTGTATDPDAGAGRAAHLHVGLRRRRHQRRHVERAEPDLHVRAAGHVPATLHGDRPERRRRASASVQVVVTARRRVPAEQRASRTSSTATRSTPTAGRSSGRTARGRRPSRAGTCNFPIDNGSLYAAGTSRTGTSSSSRSAAGTSR